MEKREAKKAKQVAKSKTTSRKRNLANTAPLTKVYPTRNRVQGGVAYREINTNTYCVCFGQHKDDIDEETGCLIPGHEWIQCNDEECGVCSHSQCLEETATGGLLCFISQNMFS